MWKTHENEARTTTPVQKNLAIEMLTHTQVHSYNLANVDLYM